MYHQVHHGATLQLQKSPLIQWLQEKFMSPHSVLGMDHHYTLVNSVGFFLIGMNLLY